MSHSPHTESNQRGKAENGKSGNSGDEIGKMAFMLTQHAPWPSRAKERRPVMWASVALTPGDKGNLRV